MQPWMTDLLLLSSRALFALVAFGAGIQLARTALREGGLPTHTWGSAIIFLGGMGLVGYAVGPLLIPLHAGLATATMAASDGLERVALLGLGVFLWKVFGPASAARRIALAVVALALLGDWVALIRFQSWPDTHLPMPLAATTHVVFALPLLWSALESGIQAAKSRRQLALGLAEPVVTNRYVLWMLGSAGLAAICLLSAVEQLLGGGLASSVLAGVRIALHTTTAGLVALGFFPPEAYVRHVSRAAAQR